MIPSGRNSKKESEVRRLGLLNVRDKIVQQAIKTLIEPRFEKMFLNNSYGYRQGRGSARTVRRVMDIYQQVKKNWVAKLDDYFETITHERLFIQLQQVLNEGEMATEEATAVEKELFGDNPKRDVFRFIHVGHASGWRFITGVWTEAMRNFK